MLASRICCSVAVAALAIPLIGCGGSGSFSKEQVAGSSSLPPEAVLLKAPGDVLVQSVFDAQELAIRFSWKSHQKTGPAGFRNVGWVYPGQFHDLMKWNGEKFDRLPKGARLDEDRISFLLEDPARPVAGFAKAGCFLACHDNMFAAENPREHHLAGFLDHWHWRGGRSGPMGYAEDAHVSDKATRQRDEAGIPPSAWIRSAGDRLREDQAALTDTGHPLAEGLPRFVFNKGKNMAGGYKVPSYFLAATDGSMVTDPHAQLPAIKDVSANRSLLVVYQDRFFDPLDKVNAIDLGYLVLVATGQGKHLPSHLRPGDATFSRERFDIWTSYWAQELQITYDPDSLAARQAAEAQLAAIHQEWDQASARQAMVTRSVGFIYPSDQHDIAATRSFDAENQIWSVVLSRKLRTGNNTDTDLSGLKKGTIYHLGFAMHDVGASHDSHHISLPLGLGAAKNADIKAVQVKDIAKTAWADVPALHTRVFMPMGKTGEWLTSAAHGGAESVGTVHCGDCHQQGGMATPLM